MSRRLLNHYAAHILRQIISDTSTSQRAFAADAGTTAQNLSRHLSHERVITTGQLSGYLRAIPTQKQPALLRAWLRDQVGPEVDDVLTALRTASVAEANHEHPDRLDATQSALSWLRREMTDDPELHQVVFHFCRRMGWPGEKP